MNELNVLTEIKELLTDISTSNKEVLTKADLQKYCGIPMGTINKNANKIPHSKIGKYLFFKKSDVDNWLLSNPIETIEKKANMHKWNKKAV